MCSVEPRLQHLLRVAERHDMKTSLRERVIAGAVVERAQFLRQPLLLIAVVEGSTDTEPQRDVKATLIGRPHVLVRDSHAYWSDVCWFEV